MSTNITFDKLPYELYILIFAYIDNLEDFIQISILSKFFNNIFDNDGKNSVAYGILQRFGYKPILQYAFNIYVIMSSHKWLIYPTNDENYPICWASVTGHLEVISC